MTITFSSCFYVFKAKFDVGVYVEWMNNFLSIVKNFNLVIYTDEHSKKFISSTDNPRIRIIIRPLEQFHQYNYKDFWISNHEQNYYLKDKVDWRVNALWSEKIWFVLDILKQIYMDGVILDILEIEQCRHIWIHLFIHWVNGQKKKNYKN